MHDGTASAASRAPSRTAQPTKQPDTPVVVRDHRRGLRQGLAASVNTSPFNLSTTSRSRRSINLPGLAG